MPVMNKIFKNIIILLAILLIVFFILFINWLRNPSGLEEERLGPRGNESIPQIALIKKAKNFVLFPEYEGNSFVVHLPLPNEYIHSSNTTSKLIKSYSSSATMFYPELNGKFHPSNANLPECNGYCGGYLRAYIGSAQNDAQIQNNIMLERLHRDRVHKDPLRKYKALENEFGLDNHFQISFPVIEEKSGGKKYATKEYLLKKDKDGNVTYLFRCSPYVPSPSCKVKFNLSTVPDLLVEISFGRHLMRDWEKVILSVDEKISSWGPSKLQINRVEK